MSSSTLNDLVIPTNESSNNNNQNGSKIKYYLIEKLLSDTNSTKTTANHHNNNNNNVPQSQSASNLVSKSSNKDFMYSNKANIGQHHKEENSNDNEDLVSETGTYTIDESPDKEESNNNNQARQANSNSTIEVVSARAAIDETFGIVIKRPEIDSSSTDPNLQEHLKSKRLSRQRNKTYSLAQELNSANNLNNTSSTLVKNNINNNNSSFSASSSSSISSYSTDSKLKKTTTYDIIMGDGKNTENHNHHEQTELDNGGSQSNLNTKK